MKRIDTWQKHIACLESLWNENVEQKLSVSALLEVIAKVRENAEIVSNREQFLADYRAFCVQQGKDYDDDEAAELYEFSASPDKYNFQIPTPLLHSMNLKNVHVVADLLAHRNWSLCEAPRDSFFITSDSPANVFVPLGHGFVMFGAGLGLPTAQVRFPVSPQLCLHIEKVKRQNRFRVSKDFVHETNRRLAHAAERFIFSPYRTARIRRLAADASQEYGNPKIDREDFLRRYRHKKGTD